MPSETKKRTIITNRIIARCYAKMAMAHFREAEKDVAMPSASAVVATNIRLETIEQYINIAGGQATEQVFGRYW